VARKTVQCEVTLPEGDVRFGTFANAFRVVSDSGGECFLDFCVYSAQEERALVVARVRVHTSFLPSVRERLSAVMRDLEMEELEVREGLLTNADGDLILFRPGGEGEQ
jgi:hypothetical protein